MEWFDWEFLGVLRWLVYVREGVCIGDVDIDVMWVFLCRLSEIGGGGFSMSLVMASWRVVRMCVRSSSMRAYSLNTR